MDTFPGQSPIPIAASRQNPIKVSLLLVAYKNKLLKLDRLIKRTKTCRVGLTASKTSRKKKEAGVLPNCSNKRAYTPSRLENDMIDREYL